MMHKLKPFFNDREREREREQGKEKEFILNRWGVQAVALRRAPHHHAHI
jgi:hypothetical protein